MTTQEDRREELDKYIADGGKLNIFGDPSYTVYLGWSKYSLTYIIEIKALPLL